MTKRKLARPTKTLPVRKTAAKRARRTNLPANFPEATARTPKPAETQPRPTNAVVELDWLRERIGWLDVDSYLLKVIRGLHDLVGSHNFAFEEQQKAGACSERMVKLGTAWCFEYQHEILEQLNLLLTSIERVRQDLREVADPQLVVTR